MTSIFLSVLHIGITAGWMILAVLAMRFLLKRMPKTWYCFLWYLVMIRLLIPFSIESPLSLIPHTEWITNDISYSKQPLKETAEEGLSATETFSAAETFFAENHIFSGEHFFADRNDSNSVNQEVLGEENSYLGFLGSLEKIFTPDVGESVNPFQIIVFVASVVWLAGVSIMLLYALISYRRVKKRIQEAVKLKDNIYQCSYIDSPFVLGVVSPKIYVPFSLSDDALSYVIAHEKTHIKRGDTFVRMAAFLLLGIYWFHPLVWIFYFLLCKDMELACDEMVIKNMGMAQKKQYSKILLECSSSHRKTLLCPPAFGENSVKQRVKNILHFHAPAVWLVAGSVVLIVMLILCFMTDPVSNSTDPQNITGSTSVMENGQGESDENVVKTENNTNSDSDTVDSQTENTAGKEDQNKEPEILTEPPLLFLQDALSSKYDSHSLQPFGYMWNYQSEEGPMGIALDCEHPLEIAQKAEALILPDYNKGENSQEEVVYQFFASIDPDLLKISEYDALEAGNTDAKPLEEKTLTDQNLIFSLKKNRIYVIHAIWEEEHFTERQWHGDAIYVLVTGPANITMYMKDYSKTEGTIAIRNDSDKQVEYGDWYDIQIKKDEKWYSMPLIVKDAGYKEIAYLAEPRSVSEWKIDWSHFYGELPSGQYRLVKKIACLNSDSPGDYVSYYLAAEFEIVHTSTQPDA